MLTPRESQREKFLLIMCTKSFGNISFVRLTNQKQKFKNIFSDDIYHDFNV